MLIISCSFFFLLAGFLPSYSENTRFEQKALITAVTRLALWRKLVYNTNNSFKAFFVLIWTRHLSSNWWASSCHIIQCDVMCLVHNIFKCLPFKSKALSDLYVIKVLHLISVLGDTKLLVGVNVWWRRKTPRLNSLSLSHWGSPLSQTACRDNPKQWK